MSICLKPLPNESGYDNKEPEKKEQSSKESQS